MLQMGIPEPHHVNHLDNRMEAHTTHNRTECVDVGSPATDDDVKNKYCLPAAIHKHGIPTTTTTPASAAAAAAATVIRSSRTSALDDVR